MEDIPPGVVTVVSTSPIPGAVAVRRSALTMVTLVAAVEPKWTPDTSCKSVPRMATVFPPVVGPAGGSTPVTVGASRYVNWSAALVGDVPPGVVTVTSTVPAAADAGDVAITSVSETGVTETPVVPKCTVVAPDSPVPMMSTTLFPVRAPALGVIEVTVGIGMYVNWSVALAADRATGVAT